MSEELASLLAIVAINTILLLLKLLSRVQSSSCAMRAPSANDD